MSFNAVDEDWHWGHPLGLHGPYQAFQVRLGCDDVLAIEQDGYYWAADIRAQPAFLAIPCHVCCRALEVALVVRVQAACSSIVFQDKDGLIFGS